MSCKPGEPCEEGLKRRRALLVLGLMAAIFLALSALSFLPSRGQAIPSEITYADNGAVDGKRVFQSYNCMGCHTIVGNGAYFAPDLTKLYRDVGPAWMEAFLPSAGMWPSEGAVRRQLQRPEVAAEAGVDTLEDYLAIYPAAAERIERRGGQRTLMPNLPLTQSEVGELVAFLKYTSEMNTEGWPPVPAIDGLETSYAVQVPGAQVAVTQVAAPAESVAEAAAPADAEAAEIAFGRELTDDLGCTGCHSPGTDAMAGPGWGGLFGHDVVLADGSTVTADDAYLAESILDPDARIVKGYEAGMMPPFADFLEDEELDALVAYIRSLGRTE